ncbi:MAG: hypothetical protein GF331_11075 [Chitinivibrionales bacterium]|nr:hypothetical protein [Chitinivibrionales bacterium]
MANFPVTLLWILPIIAFGSFLFLVAWLAENKAAEARAANDSPETKPAEPAQEADPAARRLGEIEGKIGSLTTALESQQKSVEQFQRENLAYATEVSSLKRKLDELQEEYDLLSSENFTLRAQVKKLRSELKETLGNEGRDSATVDRKLYDDTRLLKTSEVEEQARKTGN